ncbi:MAG: efflux transporter outer membrane subunit [Kiritimatiellae bacterium]|nr:efflux transporter outer membrane subunit [Kiritimatiellia bacterium]
MKPRHQMLGTAWLLLGAALLASCTAFGPARRDPGEVVRLPETYAEAAPQGVAPSNRWWETFGDDQLNRLVSAALGGNLSLAQAEARIRQAAALEKQSRSGLFPSLSLEADAGVTEQRREQRVESAAGVIVTETTDTTESYGLGLAAAYELDLWGRVRAARRSAASSREATEADRDTVAMTLAAEVALRYFELLKEQRTLVLLHQQLDNDRATLDLIELRFRRSAATALDVLEQRGVVAGALSQLAPVEANIAGLLDELAVLSGTAPGSDLGLVVREFPALPDIPDAGLPVDLLSRRPDVRAAWLRLESADWSRREASADRLPAIRLSASGTYQGDAVDVLFDYWLLRLGGDLTAPLVDGGRRRAEVERRVAVADERVAAYRQAVLKAMQEVQDALRREAAQSRHLAAIEEELRLAGAAEEQAFQRYGKGQESYLRVLTATRRRQVLEQLVVSATYQQRAYRVQLHRALGGDWAEMLDEAQSRQQFQTPGGDIR